MFVSASPANFLFYLLSVFLKDVNGGEDAMEMQAPLRNEDAGNGDVHPV